MTEDRARLYSCHKHRQLYRCTCITYSIFENITIKKNVQRLIFSICHKIYIWTELVDFLQLRHVQLWQLRNTPKLNLHRNKKKLCKKQFYVKFESPSRKYYLILTVYCCFKDYIYFPLIQSDVKSWTSYWVLTFRLITELPKHFSLWCFKII